MLRQQHLLVLLRVVEAIVFELDVLQQGALRPVFAVAVPERTHKIPFDFAGGAAMPPVFLFLFLLSQPRSTLMKSNFSRSSYFSF